MFCYRGDEYRSLCTMQVALITTPKPPAIKPVSDARLSVCSMPSEGLRTYVRRRFPCSVIRLHIGGIFAPVGPAVHRREDWITCDLCRDGLAETERGNYVLNSNCLFSRFSLNFSYSYQKRVDWTDGGESWC
jgi:hypothetical protein